jgi:hypothetical protein
VGAESRRRLLEAAERATGEQQTEFAEDRGHLTERFADDDEEETAMEEVFSNKVDAPPDRKPVLVGELPGCGGGEFSFPAPSSNKKPSALFRGSHSRQQGLSTSLFPASGAREAPSVETGATIASSMQAGGTQQKRTRSPTVRQMRAENAEADAARGAAVAAMIAVRRCGTRGEEGHFGA